MRPYHKGNDPEAWDYPEETQNESQTETDWKEEALKWLNKAEKRLKQIGETK